MEGSEIKAVKLVLCGSHSSRKSEIHPHACAIKHELRKSRDSVCELNALKFAFKTGMAQ